VVEDQINRETLNHLLTLLEDIVSLLNTLNLSINLIQSRLTNLKEFLEKNVLSKMSSSSATVIVT
jgi:hypothetical protein